MQRFDYSYRGQTLEYEVLSEVAGTCRVAGWNDVAGELSIPQEAGGYDVTEIGEKAFYGCGGLRSVDIPASVEVVGDDAFFGCGGLRSVDIPPSVTAVGEGTFGECGGLTAVTIPASVASIAAGAFGGCGGLVSVRVEDGNPVYSSVEGVVYDKERTVLRLVPAGRTGAFSIPASVTAIAEGAFRDCCGLTSVFIPASVTEIGRGAFLRCRGLTAVDIPASVESIGRAAFGWCRGLRSVVVPASVTEVGGYAFWFCDSLREVACRCVKPPRLGEKVFDESVYASAMLRVPRAAAEAYRAAGGWRRFRNITGASAAG